MTLFSFLLYTSVATDKLHPRSPSDAEVSCVWTFRRRRGCFHPGQCPPTPTGPWTHVWGEPAAKDDVPRTPLQQPASPSPSTADERGTWGLHSTTTATPSSPGSTTAASSYSGLPTGPAPISSNEPPHVWWVWGTSTCIPDYWGSPPSSPHPSFWSRYACTCTYLLSNCCRSSPLFIPFFLPLPLPQEDRYLSQQG